MKMETSSSGMWGTTDIEDRNAPRSLWVFRAICRKTKPSLNKAHRITHRLLGRDIFLTGRVNGQTRLSHLRNAASGTSYGHSCLSGKDRPPTIWQRRHDEALGGVAASRRMSRDPVPTAKCASPPFKGDVKRTRPSIPPHVRKTVQDITSAAGGNTRSPRAESSSPSISTSSSLVADRTGWRTSFMPTHWLDTIVLSLNRWSASTRGLSFARRFFFQQS